MNTLSAPTYIRLPNSHRSRFLADEVAAANLSPGGTVTRERLEKSLSNTLNHKVGKVRAVKSEDVSECIPIINRQVLDTLLDTDALECTALLWLHGEFKDSLFDQMLKES